MELWASRELPYRATEHKGSGEIDLLRITGPGTGPYLFTAPHSVRSIRRGAVKQADMGTGGLAEALAELTASTALTVVGRQTGDPNWDVELGAFKREVLARRGLIVIAGEHGLVARTGAPFDATWPGTITATVQVAGGTALQVEVAGRARRPVTRKETTAPLLGALLEWLN